MSTIRILHTNDFHGRLNAERFEILRQIRPNHDLYFDTGDLIKTGNLGIPLKPDPAWQFLSQLECTASVSGNRESHVSTSALNAKLAGLHHPIICANLFNRDGERPFPGFMETVVRGVRVGILGVMVPMVTERMASRAVSQYLWSQPIPEAVKVSAELRTRNDLVIALTHIGFTQDKKLAESTTNIDLIFGGHSHTVLESPVKVADTWIAQGGSHGRFFGSYELDVEKGELTGGLFPLIS